MCISTLLGSITYWTTHFLLNAFFPFWLHPLQSKISAPKMENAFRTMLNFFFQHTNIAYFWLKEMRKENFTGENRHLTSEENLTKGWQTAAICIPCTAPCDHGALRSPCRNSGLCRQEDWQWTMGKIIYVRMADQRIGKWMSYILSPCPEWTLRFIVPCSFGP